MHNYSEFDGTIEDITMVFNLLYEGLERGLQQLDKSIDNNSEVQKAHHSHNIEAFDQLLQQKSQGKFLRMLMEQRTEKAIGLRLVEKDVFIENTVQLLNLILADLYGENPPISFRIDEVEKNKYGLFLQSAEPLSQLKKVQGVFQQIELKLKELQEQLLTESFWQLDVTASGYFHSTISPAMMYPLMTLYVLNKVKQDVDLPGIEEVHSGTHELENGIVSIRNTVFTGNAIRQILCQQFGFKNLFLPFDTEVQYTELAKAAKEGSHALRQMKPGRDNMRETKIASSCLERTLAILEPFPCARMQYKYKQFGLASIKLQILMEKFQTLKAISAKDALQFKRDLEAIKQQYDSVVLSELYEETLTDIIPTFISLSTIFILSCPDKQIEGFTSDAKRIEAISGSCYNIYHFFDLFDRLASHTKECVALKQFNRLDIMWIAFSNELQKFLARVTASSLIKKGNDENILLNALSDFMLRILAVETGTKPRVWQIQILMLFINHLKVLAIPLSKHPSSRFVITFITELTATSNDFKKVCEQLGIELLTCLKNEINENNQFLLINRAAFAINVLYRNPKTSADKIIDACNFLLDKLQACPFKEESKKNVRENLSKIKEILEHRKQPQQDSKSTYIATKK